MRKKALVVGHAYIIPANRKIWSDLAQHHEVDVTLITPSEWKSNLVGEVKFERNEFDKLANFEVDPISTYFRGNGSFYFYKPLDLLKVLENKKFDFAIINQEGWSLSLLVFNLVTMLTKNRGLPIYLMIAQNIFKKKLWWSWPLEHFNMSFVNTALGCCVETKEVLRKKGINTKWEYFPLFFNGKVEESSDSQETQKIRFGYIGRLSEEKGLETLLDAFKTLSQFESIELVVVGDGPMRARVSGEEVKYLGLLPHDKVSSFYQSIDVLVVPSLTKPFWKEQFGRVIVEAIAQGVYVIGSNSGAIPEVLGHLELKGIFQEGNVEALRTEMKKTIELSRSNSLKEAVSRAQVLCEEKFSTRAFNKRLMEITSE